MTKEEIANIKRIDTSLNVFRKRIKALEEKKKKLISPIEKEIEENQMEIDWWQKPVVDRYGKTTEELLKEAGEQTAEEVSEEEEKEVVKEPEAECPATKEENVVPEDVKNTESPELYYEPDNDIPDGSDWPKEWED